MKQYLSYLIIFIILIISITLIIIYANHTDTNTSDNNNKENNTSSINEENNTEIEEDNSSTSETVKINRNSTLSDITFQNDKINLYFFWGAGCPHCEELFSFLESIQNEYGKYFNVYAFEVWYNEENGKIMDYFLEEFNDNVGKRSVPYFIIGDEPFEGYNSSKNDTIINTILSKYKDRNNIKNFESILNLNN